MRAQRRGKGAPAPLTEAAIETWNALCEEEAGRKRMLARIAAKKRSRSALKRCSPTPLASQDTLLTESETTVFLGWLYEYDTKAYEHVAELLGDRIEANQLTYDEYEKAVNLLFDLKLDDYLRELKRPNAVFGPPSFIADVTVTKDDDRFDSERGYVTPQVLLRTYVSERLRKQKALRVREQKSLALRRELIEKTLDFIDKEIEKASAKGEQPPPDRELNRLAATEFGRLNREEAGGKFKHKNYDDLLAAIRRWRRDHRKQQQQANGITTGADKLTPLPPTHFRES